RIRAWDALRGGPAAEGTESRADRGIKIATPVGRGPNGTAEKFGDAEGSIERSYERGTRAGVGTAAGAGKISEGAGIEIVDELRICGRVKGACQGPRTTVGALLYWRRDLRHGP